jgi:hypothetical protein
MKNKNKLAIEAIRKQIQPIAFDANLWDRKIASYPHAQHCSEKRNVLLAEIARLEREQQEPIQSKMF